MANTPIFGWETPDDTDYVYQGAAAARTTANAIDTTMATRVNKAGDTMTGALTATNLKASTGDLVLQQNGSGNAGVNFLNTAGAVSNGYILLQNDNAMVLYLTSNGNSLNLNNLGETTRSHNTVTRPLPFAQQAGAISIGASTSATVTLASGRFTVTPHVFITPFQNTNPGVVVTGKVSSVSAGAIEITNTTTSTVVFYWQAIQMTSTSASG
jgi:hypothetical protein